MASSSKPTVDPRRSRAAWKEPAPQPIPDISSFDELVTELRRQLTQAQQKVQEIEQPKGFRFNYSPILSMNTPGDADPGASQRSIEIARQQAQTEFATAINPTIHPIGMSSPKYGGPSQGTITQLALTELNVFLKTYVDLVQQGNSRAYDTAIETAWNEIGKKIRSPEAVMINQQACRKVNDNMYSSKDPRINKRLNARYYDAGSQVEPERYCDYAGQVQRVFNFVVKPVFDFVESVEKKLKANEEKAELRKSRDRYDILKGDTTKLKLS
jgi:hypothetical protein